MSETALTRLIADWLDGRISESDSDLLQQQLRESADARAAFHEFTHLDAALREAASGEGDLARADEISAQRFTKSVSPTRRRSAFDLTRWSQLAIAAALLLTVGFTAYQLGKSDTDESPTPLAVQEYSGDANSEQTIAGYASLRRVAGIEWSEDAHTYREGDVLPAGILEFKQGVAEIDFFCGAGVIVEGPAKLQLESDWSVRLLAGRLRANVPPAARGFVVKAADSEIIDLGTEFALEVGPENVRVEVVDGEVKLRGGRHDGDHLVTGESQSLVGSDSQQNSLKSLSTIGDVQRRHEIEQRQRLQQWKIDSQRLRTDERLIAYYPLVETQSDRVVRNAASTGSASDGHLVGLVERTTGRFGSVSSGLGFDRPGSRVRTRIEGDFQAFTFACWVKIDSLEHKYNALFMGDGYENGEPHWQIRDDGRLMFSVMVDDTQNVQVPNAFDQKIVQDAGLHRVYFTEPFWDISKSGQWFHIATVYDPIDRRVVQYVNGEQLSDEVITEKFHITTLRIGPAEIGNWGQPFRNSPWFAVRNLNGAIDELAIFNAALTSEEIQSLYEQGKPLGY